MCFLKVYLIGDRITIKYGLRKELTKYMHNHNENSTKQQKI